MKHYVLNIIIILNKEKSVQICLYKLHSNRNKFSTFIMSYGCVPIAYVIYVQATIRTRQFFTCIKFIIISDNFRNY